MTRHDLRCTVNGCTNSQHSRGWCRKHYMRWWEHGDPTFLKEVHAASGEPAAFLQSIPDDGVGCLTWPFATNGVGYAQINMGEGKKVLVSRVVCERRHGPPPTERHQAAHNCGNGHEACVAPWHLEWKTPKANNADIDTHGRRPRGEAAPGARLTEDAVRQIRLRASSASQIALAREFGVSPATISHVVNRVGWKHVA